MQCSVQLTQLQILRNMSSLQLSEASGESLEAKGELCLRLLLQPGQIPMSHLEVPPHETYLHEADCCSYSERSLWAEGPLGGDALPGNTRLKDGHDCRGEQVLSRATWPFWVGGIVSECPCLQEVYTNADFRSKIGILVGFLKLYSFSEMHKFAKIDNAT